MAPFTPKCARIETHLLGRVHDGAVGGRHLAAACACTQHTHTHVRWIEAVRVEKASHSAECPTKHHNNNAFTLQVAEEVLEPVHPAAVTAAASSNDLLLRALLARLLEFDR